MRSRNECARNQRADRRIPARAFLDVLSGYTVEAFRTLVQTGDEQATPEIAVEHLAQHEAEHRGAIWEARVAAEAELGIG